MWQPDDGREALEEFRRALDARASLSRVIDESREILRQAEERKGKRASERLKGQVDQLRGRLELAESVERESRERLLADWERWDAVCKPAPRPEGRLSWKDALPAPNPAQVFDRRRLADLAEQARGLTIYLLTAELGRWGKPPYKTPEEHGREAPHAPKRKEGLDAAVRHLRRKEPRATAGELGLRLARFSENEPLRVEGFHVWREGKRVFQKDEDGKVQSVTFETFRTEYASPRKKGEE